MIQSVFGYLGVLSIALSALAKLVSNWKADFLSLKCNRRLIKVIFSSILAIYIAYAVISGITTYDGYILYQGNPIVTVYLFSIVAVLGVGVGAVEDYYKRYSRAEPNLIIVFLTTASLIATFVALFVAQGVFLITRDPNYGEVTIGIVMIAVSILLGLIIMIITLWMRKIILRISLLVNVAIVPGFTIFILAVGGGFSASYFFDSLVLYVSFTYPTLILSELFTLALISRQRNASVSEQLCTEVLETG